MAAFVGGWSVVEPSRRRSVVVCGVEKARDGGWKRVAAVVVAGVSLFGRPASSAAVRGGGAMFKMTEQAAEFVLPSQKEAQEKEARRGSGEEGFIKKTAKVGLKVAPYVVSAGTLAAGVYYGIQYVQQSQVKRFQKDLQGMSSMFGEQDMTPVPRQKKTRVDTAAMAKAILEKSKTKYKFRERTPARDRSAQIKLDLFQDQPEEKSSTPVDDLFAAPPATEPESAVPVAETAATETPTATNSFEEAIAAYLNGNGDVNSVKVSASTMGVTDVEATAMIGEFGSNTLTTLIDAVVAKLRMVMGGAAMMPPLDEVNSVARTAASVRKLTSEGFDKDVTVRYGGKMLNSEMAEEIYRIFAVSVLSKGTAQDANEVKQLEDLQMLLGISADRASATYDEVVKAMMQEAMNQANLDPEAREMLDKLRGAFNDDMGGGTGDMNQDVMRMMYALQQMMTEQGISDEDAVEMRKMMQEMGIDTKELIQNAEMLVDVLGPEAKPLIESLKKLLVDDVNITEVSSTPVVDTNPGSIPGTNGE